MFRLPEKVKQSIDEYKRSLSDVRREKLTPSRFKGVRVPWGIYSHRGGEVFMTRVRIPVGAITSSQLRALAEAASKYGQASLHITTRQDIQIHDVRLTDTAKVIEYLKDYDLSPRGGGGNTIRNVVACPRSGICPDEAFDVRGSAVALTEHLLRQESSFNLPRKFKISFSGCAHDCAGCLVNDAGFQAKYQDKKKGFAVFIGGGLGAHSRIGQSLTEFLPEEDLGYCVAAMNNVYCHTGNRRNKHHNRLRFLIEDMGMAKFRELYVQEFAQLKRDTDITLRQIQFRSMADTKGEIPTVADEQFQEFLQYNVKPQRQRGLSSIDLRIPRGDISSKKLSAIAALVEDFENISFGTTQNQNLIIAGVRNKDTYRLFVKLKETLDDFLYPETAIDVVACKGALTCNLGLCNSPGLAEAIETSLQKEMVGKKIFGKLQLKLNGCPNSCGQHPVGMVSLCGMARQIDNHRAPYYKLFLGGRKGIEKTKLAEAVGIIPAKNVVNFLREFFDQVEQSIGEHDDLYRFLAEQGKSIATSILARHSRIPAYEEDRDYYIDWGKNEEFSLDGLGPGECGAGVLDMIEADLKDAWSAIDKAAADHCSPREIRRALFYAARALLIVKGHDPRDEQETFARFADVFIKGRIVSDEYAAVKAMYDRATDKLASGARGEILHYAVGFLQHIKELYASMDSSFNFPLQEKIAQNSEIRINELDLRGTPCPINYVKTKLVLEELEFGAILAVLLDEGEPIINVPRSLKEDGHEISRIEDKQGFYRVVVKNGGGMK